MLVADLVGIIITSEKNEYNVKKTVTEEFV